MRLNMRKRLYDIYKTKTQCAEHCIENCKMRCCIARVKMF